MRLIEIRDPQGACLAVCDSRCYNADSPLCCCVCDGENHGVGLHQAINNTREKWMDWADTFCKTLPKDHRSVIDVNPNVFKSLIL